MIYETVTLYYMHCLVLTVYEGKIQIINVDENNLIIEKLNRIRK